MKKHKELKTETDDSFSVQIAFRGSASRLLHIICIILICHYNMYHNNTYNYIIRNMNEHPPPTHTYLEACFVDSRMKSACCVSAWQVSFP